MKDIKAVFDIGNDSIKTVVFAKDEEKDLILFKHIENTRGMRKGKFLDTEEFTETLWKIVEKIVQKLWGDFIDEVFVGVSHPETIVKRISEQKRIMDNEIRENDVEHLSKVVADVALQTNYETVKILPVSWIIDDTKREKDPLGFKGKRLELVADAFMIPKNFYNTIIESFDTIGLAVVDIIPNIIASSEIILDYDRKDLGTVLVDIGKNQTSYAIFEDGYCLGYGNIPLGGEDVTKDISIGMQIDIKEAEEIKKINGMTLLDKKNKDKETLDTHFLTDIISARYEEIFDKINDKLVIMGKDGRLPWGIVLIGGGARTPNLDILCKNIFKLATFFGKPSHNNIWDLGNNIQFINVLGVYIRGNKYVEGRKGTGIKFDFKIVEKIQSFFKNLF